ncbi:MAG: sigma-70 family RNA polymerase sigma factor [Pirellulaceae bacterium]
MSVSLLEQRVVDETHMAPIRELPKDATPSILQRIAAGDQSAVEECLSRYGGLVWTIASRLSQSSADAEDATQEVFVELWRKAAHFDPSKSAEPTFVSMVARRRLIDRLRSSETQRTAESVSCEGIDVPEEVAVNTPEIRDEAEKAMRCVKKLSTEQQKVISLTVHSGLSHRLVSERLSMPLGTVKSFARRALLQLRECMDRPQFPAVERGV